MTPALLLLLFAQADPRWHEPHLLAAKSYLARQDFSRAAETLDALLEAQPDLPPEIHLLLIESRRKLNQADRAAEAGERGIKAHPDSGPLLKLTGSLLFRISFTDPRAGELLERAARALPKDPEALHVFGQWAIVNHREEAAIEAETKALALAGNNGAARMQIHTVLAVAYDKLGRAKPAEESFRQAFAANRKLASPDPNSALEYAQFLVRQSREEEAHTVVDEILRMAPAFGPARLERARRLSAEGRHEDALAEARRALELAGADRLQQRAAHAFLARTLFALGREEEAQTHQNWIEEHTR
jgi:tetratricopeptide (TPR) repeat protein